jgi:hypothetical protein
VSLLSVVKRLKPNPSCRNWFTHWMRWALALAAARVGSSIAAKIAMMAITTNSSIRVKPRPERPRTARAAGLPPKNRR